MQTKILLLFFPFLMALHAFPDGIQLNFGDGLTVATFPSPTSTLDYGLVGNDGTVDIYAQIEALNIFGSSTSGASGGDAVINVFAGETAQLKLSLFQDAGYTTAYAPGSVYSWTATFADIEGSGGSINNYETLTLHSPGSYEVTTDSVLKISADGSSTTFSGRGASTYTNPNPSADELTEEQGQVAVAYTASNRSWFEFDYSAFGVGRSIFIDVGNLVFSPASEIDTSLVGEVVVPEPASLVFFLLGISGIVAALFIRRK